MIKTIAGGIDPLDATMRAEAIGNPIMRHDGLEENDRRWSAQASIEDDGFKTSMTGVSSLQTIIGLAIMPDKTKRGSPIG